MIKHWLAATAGCLLLATGTLALAGDDDAAAARMIPPAWTTIPGAGTAVCRN
jgi:hypothetical protein